MSAHYMVWFSSETNVPPLVNTVLNLSKVTPLRIHNCLHELRLIQMQLGKVEAAARSQTGYNPSVKISFHRGGGCDTSRLNKLSICNSGCTVKVEESVLACYLSPYSGAVNAFLNVKCTGASRKRPPCCVGFFGNRTHTF